VFDRTEGKPPQSIHVSASTELYVIPTNLEEIEQPLVALVSRAHERPETIDVPRLGSQSFWTIQLLLT
jgi:hypothetical protein